MYLLIPIRSLSLINKHQKQHISAHIKAKERLVVFFFLYIFLLPPKHSHPPTDDLRGSAYLINLLQLLKKPAVTFEGCININQSYWERSGFEEAQKILNGEGRQFQVSLFLLHGSIICQICTESLVYILVMNESVMYFFLGKIFSETGQESWAPMFFLFLFPLLKKSFNRLQPCSSACPDITLCSSFSFFLARLQDASGLQAQCLLHLRDRFIHTDVTRSFAFWHSRIAERQRSGLTSGRALGGRFWGASKNNHLKAELNLLFLTKRTLTTALSKTWWCKQPRSIKLCFSACDESRNHVLNPFCSMLVEWKWTYVTFSISINIWILIYHICLDNLRQTINSWRLTPSNFIWLWLCPSQRDEIISSFDIIFHLSSFIWFHLLGLISTFTLKI